jgi:hypothetical protein
MPYELSNEVFFTENIITQVSHITNSAIINTNENNPIIPQQISRQTKPRVHHVKPVGVKPSHCFGVALGCLLRHLAISSQRIGEVVGVDKIVAGVVGWVYKVTVFDTIESSGSYPPRSRERGENRLI